ncbi:MAG: hypothetical protein KAR79_00455 [Simkaniaceae bacterium]|nr:hypothetical protein [Simkaniaceae bacterium]
MKRVLTAIKSEFSSYSKAEKYFIFFAMLCSFIISAEYAVTKPSCVSIFLSTYTVKFFPYVWLVMVPINLLVVTLYNRFLPKIGCFQMAACVVLFTIGVSEMAVHYLKEVKSAIFALVLWKDIYVLLMFQQLWSVIQAKIDKRRAKYLYGIIFGVGGIGAILGSTIPAFLAVKVGSVLLLHFTAPLFIIFLLVFYFALKVSGFGAGSYEDVQMKKLENKFSDGFLLIKSSQTLKYILLIVVFMQLSSTLIEYQFSAHLEKTIPNQDLRTEFFGSIRGIINTVNLTLQFFGSFILIQCFGLKRSHVIIPGVLLVNALGSFFYPTFRMLSYSYITIKGCDYSVFNIIKEMLYVPLKLEEKFKAKALIDIFAYRTSKVFATLFILGLQAFIPEKLQGSALFFGPIIMVSMWLLSAYFMLHKNTEIDLQNAL